MDQTLYAIYARVSTTEQAKGYSIEAQIDACKQHAAANGGSVVETYIDPGKSGGTDERPGFQAMIRDALAGKFSVILVHKFDRFSRNREHSVVYKSLLREHGIQVVSVSQPIGNDPGGVLLEGITEVFDEFFRINLRTETLKGQLRMINEGKWPTRVPFGYEKTDEGQVIVSDVGPQITMAFREFATGQYTLRSWADEAYRRGIRTQKGKKVNFTQWSYTFNNKFYKGILSWMGTDYPGQHAPLVDPETFATVQAVLAANENNITRTHYRFYLLRGLVWSLDANNTMNGAVGGGFRYYRSRTPVEGGTRHHVLADRLEAQVAKILECVTIDPSDVEGLDIDDLFVWPLQVAPNAGVFYQRLTTDEQRLTLCRLIIAKYGLKVSGQNIIAIETRSPFRFEGVDFLEVPPAGLEPALPAPEAGALSSELRGQM